MIYQRTCVGCETVFNAVKGGFLCNDCRREIRQENKSPTKVLKATKDKRGGEMIELYMLVARQYLERVKDDAVIHSAVRHWPYHGPATKDSCEQVQEFVEQDPDNTWDVFYNIVSMTDYMNGRFE